MWWHTRKNQTSSLGGVHLNRRGRQFSRLLAAEVCISAIITLDTPSSVVVWRVLAIHFICQFPVHFPSRTSPCAITFQPESRHLQNAPRNEKLAEINRLAQRAELFVHLLGYGLCDWGIVVRFPKRKKRYFFSPKCRTGSGDEQFSYRMGNSGAKLVPVTTAWRVLGLRMEERPPIWRVAANIFE